MIVPGLRRKALLIAVMLVFAVLGSVSAQEIELRPLNQSLLVGQPASFRLNLENRSGYQISWYYNLTNLLANQTNATLSINSVTPADRGIYHAEVKFEGGSLKSASLQEFGRVFPGETPIRLRWQTDIVLLPWNRAESPHLIFMTRALRSSSEDTIVLEAPGICR
jgi:hypothetical protein